MSSVTIPIHACHRLDHEKRLQQTEEIGSNGHIGARWWTRTLQMTPAPQPPKDTGKNRAAKHCVNAGNTQH